MESSLLDTAAAAGLCPAAAAGRRRAGSTASFVSCSCTSRDCRVSASYSHSISRMLSGARSAARKKLFRTDQAAADLLAIANWSDETTGGHHLQQQQHWWTALENNFVLEATDDEYDGVVVDADRLPTDKAAFARSLAASLSYWKSVLREERGVVEITGGSSRVRPFSSEGRFQVPPRGGSLLDDDVLDP